MYLICLDACNNYGQCRIERSTSRLLPFSCSLVMIATFHSTSPNPLNTQLVFMIKGCSNKSKSSLSATLLTQLKHNSLPKEIELFVQFSKFFKNRCLEVDCSLLLPVQLRAKSIEFKIDHKRF